MNIIHGDCLEELKKLEDNSIDAVVCDPPYGLSNTKPQQVADVLKAWVTGDTVSVPAKKGGFMGADWDSFVPPPAVWEECMRVLKPGGHMAVFAGARTQDLMGLSIRLAGFEIRDTLGWVYSQGFPKSMDVSKAIDRQRDEDREPRVAVTSWVADECASLGWSRSRLCKAFGVKNQPIQSWTERNPDYAVIPTWENWQKLKALVGFGDGMDAEVWRLNGRKGTPGEAWEQREVVGVQKGAMSGWNMDGTTKFVDRNITTPATSEAQRWDGWGTALKPAIEPIILARKPLDGTVASNVLSHGVGGLNIDACRVPSDEVTGWGGAGAGGQTWNSENMRLGKDGDARPVRGRFPANVLLDEHAAKEMDEQSGHIPPSSRTARRDYTVDNGIEGFLSWVVRPEGESMGYTDSGGASRFFPVFKYQAKAPKKERPVIEREDGTKIQHSTVKPLALMEWLVSLIVPPGGVVLDPFAGSGTTLQAAINKGFTPIGIEQDADYIKLIEKRLEATCTTHKN